MSEQSGSTLKNLLKKAVGLPTGQSSCCGPAPAPAPEKSGAQSGCCSQPAGAGEKKS
ncbi:MAG TPA: hypothetical protein VD969_11455 [Symbiobacteriaceae bacterium]|nr:hypothetical protein [Symbiobacteriaceae bacterium]